VKEATPWVKEGAEAHGQLTIPIHHREEHPLTPAHTAVNTPDDTPEGTEKEILDDESGSV
jgi:hypothetical protein